MSGPKVLWYLTSRGGGGRGGHVPVSRTPLVGCVVVVVCGMWCRTRVSCILERAWLAPTRIEAQPQDTHTPLPLALFRINEKGYYRRRRKGREGGLPYEMTTVPCPISHPTFYEYMTSLQLTIYLILEPSNPPTLQSIKPLIQE